MMPPSIQVCPIEIPGRGRREGEPSITDVHELADILARSLPLQVHCIFILNDSIFVIVSLHISIVFERLREMQKFYFCTWHYSESCSA